MFPRLTNAKYTSDYHLWLTFSDGREGEIDLTEELWGEVFEPLKNIDLFKSFVLDLELNTLRWPTGADLAPEFLYSMVANV
jgi:Protein of unknown function (DUF2442)